MLLDHAATTLSDGPRQILPIAELIQGSLDRWWASPTTLPDLGRRFTPAEQAAFEGRVGQLAEGLSAELDQPPLTRAAQQAVQQRYVGEAARLLPFALGVTADDVAALRMAEFADLLMDYARQARRFDSRLSADDIVQAGRNVMSAGLLQLLLGRPLELTPAILAYSLLYPYSDNILDDPHRSASAKRAFNQRFRQRLAGQPLRPADETEAAIDRLVGMVEGQYHRQQHPKVFASLLAIHAAQTRSLELMQAGAAPYEVDLLGITCDKGGTSVLADAYLVAGDLTAKEEKFAFELGAFLQFMDDLEDVETDGAAGRLSIFALAARRWQLDALTNRALHFGAGVLGTLDQSGLPVAAGTQTFLQHGLRLALILAAGRARRWYRRGYWIELEAHAPFRFAFVERLGRRLARQMSGALPRLENVLTDPATERASHDYRASGPAVSTVR
jgi:hypothetical protein